MTERSPVSESSTARLLDHAAEVIRLVASIKTWDVDAILALLRQRRENGGTVFVAGNGGSAANASHCAMHLRECDVKALCLTDGVPSLTALSNDFSYHDALWRSAGRILPADMALVFSCSGTSPNIIHLLEQMRGVKARTAGVFGFGEHATGRALCDASVVLDSRDYAAVEDAHSAVLHMLKLGLATT